MRERTSSRCVYFEHYKAAAEDNILLNLQYLIAEIPFWTSYMYSPKRWKAATNVMLSKKERRTDIDKLRTLILLKSDFNHNNKFLRRSMMYHAEIPVHWLQSNTLHLEKVYWSCHKQKTVFWFNPVPKNQCCHGRCGFKIMLWQSFSCTYLPGNVIIWYTIRTNTIYVPNHSRHEILYLHITWNVKSKLWRKGERAFCFSQWSGSR